MPTSINDIDAKQLEEAAKKMGGGMPNGLPGLGGGLPLGLSGFWEKEMTDTSRAQTILKEHRKSIDRSRFYSCIHTGRTLQTDTGRWPFKSRTFFTTI